MACIEPMHRNKPNITYLLKVVFCFGHFTVVHYHHCAILLTGAEYIFVTDVGVGMWGIAYCGLPFPDTGCLVPNADIHYFSDMMFWDTASSFIYRHWMFLHTDICLNNNMPPSYRIYIMNLGK